MEFRPPQTKVDLSVYHSRYDDVLDLSKSRSKTFEELKKEMKVANVGHAIIHAEYEYGDPADLLNEAVAKLVQEEPLLFSGVGTISMENLNPMRAVKQLERVKEL